MKFQPDARRSRDPVQLSAVLVSISERTDAPEHLIGTLIFPAVVTQFSGVYAE